MAWGIYEAIFMKFVPDLEIFFHSIFTEQKKQKKGHCFDKRLETLSMLGGHS